MEILCRGLNDLESVAASIFKIGKDYHVWILKGEMGSGKTTFIHALSGYLGVVDKVNSPSYSIINEYRTIEGKTIYNFDFLRIKTMEEALDTGFMEYLDSDDYCFIEWPEMIENLLTEPYLEIHIKASDMNTRIFNIYRHAR